jgi:hypothetical protein
MDPLSFDMNHIGINGDHSGSWYITAGCKQGSFDSGS